MLMKLHIKATEMLHIVRLATERSENSLFFQGFLYSSIWLNFVILTLFAQVMTSDTNGANYGGYIPLPEI